MRNFSMKKFGTPIGAGPGSAREKSGCRSSATPSGWRRWPCPRRCASAGRRRSRALRRAASYPWSRLRLLAARGRPGRCPGLGDRPGFGVVVGRGLPAWLVVGVGSGRSRASAGVVGAGLGADLRRTGPGSRRAPRGSQLPPRESGPSAVWPVSSLSRMTSTQRPPAGSSDRRLLSAARPQRCDEQLPLHSSLARVSSRTAPPSRGADCRAKHATEGF